MGSYSSRHTVAHTNIVPKPLEVLPATESWSTLDAFQVTVKKSEHHELINRSKTQKSLHNTVGGFFHKDHSRRAKTLAKIPTSDLTSSSDQQLRGSKKHASVRTKTQSNLSPTSCTSEQVDCGNQQTVETQFIECQRNSRRPSHFYEVRQALVNRQPLHQLDRIVSFTQSQSNQGEDDIQRSPNLDIVKHPDDNKQPELSSPTKVTKTNLTTQHLATVSPSAVKLENKAQNVANCNVVSSPEVLTSGFRVDSTPHTMFAPDSQQSELELQCQETIAKLAPLSSEESARKEIEELLQQWVASGQLARIEAHALSIPSSQTSTVAELADGLVGSNAEYLRAVEGNELYIQVAKAYCIYVWIGVNIAYDIEQWQGFVSDDQQNLVRTEAKDVLDSRVTVCTGYANLFKTLACMSGLEVNVIHGSAKLWKSLLPMEEKLDADIPFKPRRANAHTWNSVEFGCVPYLLDCTFASGYVTPEMKFCKTFNRHYFAVPPQQMILTHWPLNETWQLLEEPLTLDKFQPLIPMAPSTVGFGIVPETWSEIVEVLDDPVVHIKLRCKDSVKIFATLVTSEEANSHNTVKESNLERFVYTNQEKNRVSIRAAPPHRGQFSLKIYASNHESSFSQGYHLVLSYLILCKREVMNEVGYPTVSTAAALQFNFSLLHWNAPKRDYCCESSGKLDVVFKAQPDLQFYHCIIPVKTDTISSSQNQISDTYHFNTLMVRNEVGDPGLYMLRTIFPTQGWWTLYLYAKKSEVDIDSESTQNGYALVLAYSVYVQIGMPEHSYPNIHSPFISMLRPESLSASGNEIFSFHFISTKQFDFHSYLTYDRQTGGSMENFTAVRNIVKPNSCRLDVIFPRPGKWYVHVFGKDLANPKQKSYSELLVLRIEVNGSLKETFFPKVNQPLAEALSVSHLDSGSITFQDDGSPFTYQFTIPKKNIDLIHSIKPHSTGSKNLGEEFLQYCTSLSFDTHAAGDSKSLIICTLNAVFPWAGMWTVQVFATSIGSNNYECLTEVKIQVCNPTPNICYAKVHPSFYHLDLNIPNKFLSYDPVTDVSEIEIPFKAPESVQFVWNMEFVKNGEKFFHQAIVHHRENLNQDSDCSSLNRILHMIFPKPGEWVFHMYGRNAVTNSSATEQEEKNNYQSVMEIRIKVLSFNDEAAFPHIFDPFQRIFGMKLDKKSCH